MIPDYNIFNDLFKGGYITHRPCHNKRYGYAMYSTDGALRYSITVKQFDRNRNIFKVKSGKFTLNLSSVRQQHGNSDVKQLYKKFKSEKDGIGSTSPKAGI